MRVEQSVERLAEETEVLGENLPQCRFVYHKSHRTWPGLEPGRRGEKPAWATGRLAELATEHGKLRKCWEWEYEWGLFQEQGGHILRK
jgi:hypothetical protein